MKASTPAGRLRTFDFLRGMAILYIVGVRHLDGYAGDLYHSRADDVIAYSVLGLFVFISGYLLKRSHPAIGTRKQLRTFLVRRFLRIYPLYVMALVAFWLCSLMSLQDVLQHVFLANIVLNSSTITLWFVSMLCVFYLLFPLLNRDDSLRRTLIVSAAFCCIAVLLKLAWQLIDIRVVIFFPLFVLGILASRYDLEATWFCDTRVRAGAAVGFLAASALYFSVPRCHSVFLVSFMICSLPLFGLLARIITPRLHPSVYGTIAYASYGMYLFHHPVFMVMTRLYRPASDAGTALYLTVLGLPAVVGMAWGIQKGYDVLLRKTLCGSRTA